MTLVYLATFAVSLLLSFISTKIVRDLALRRGWVSPPAHQRHLHSKALPRLGGIAIVFSFLFATCVAVASVRLLHPEGGSFSLHRLVTILPPAILIFLLGVYDDLRGAGPWLKFLVQGVAGAMLFAGGLQIFDLPLLFGARHFSWMLGLPLTIFWVIAITNAFNLIDGLDGLAAGSALFSTLVMFVVAALGNASLISLITLALAGAVLGFLRYNFNPATIFLGDCGSQFVGFMLSALALYGAQKAPTIVSIAIPLVSFGLPILETSLSVLRRFISGRPVFTADREHIHHKLLDLGWSHRQVVIILYGVSGVFALLSLFLLWPTGSTLGLVLAVVGTGIWLGVQHLGYLEFGELRRIALRTIEQRRIFVNNLAIRRATEEFKVARDLEQVGRILTAAFDSNDFDGFELRANSPVERRIQLLEPNDVPHLHWQRRGDTASLEPGFAWSIRLELISSAAHRCGNLTIFRRYTNRDLQVDINLLTSDFATNLANALQRSILLPGDLEFASAAGGDAFLTAQAG